MQSIAFALLIFAGILAYGNAAPQMNLGWLQAVLAEAGQRNTTVKFGNNTVIITGVSNSVANSNQGNTTPSSPRNQWNNNWYPYHNNGYYRIMPTINGQIVEGPQSSAEESHEISQEFSHEISQSYEESGEDQYHQEDQTEEDEDDNETDLSEDQLDDLEEDQLDKEEELEDGHDQSEEDNENEDELIDPEEDAIDQVLDDIEKEIAARENE